MATIVNNPGNGDKGGAGGWVVAIVLIVILLLLALFVFPDAFDGDDDVVPVETNGVNDGTGTEPPPVINNTTFNSTTTINTGTTTDLE